MIKLRKILSEVKLIRQIPIYNNSDNNEWDLYINDKVYSIYKRIMNTTERGSMCDYIIPGRWQYDEMDEIKSFLNKHNIPYIYNNGVNNFIEEVSWVRVEKIYFKEM